MIRKMKLMSTNTSILVRYERHGRDSPSCVRYMCLCVRGEQKGLGNRGKLTVCIQCVCTWGVGGMGFHAQGTAGHTHQYLVTDCYRYQPHRKLDTLVELMCGVYKSHHIANGDESEWQEHIPHVILQIPCGHKGDA